MKKLGQFLRFDWDGFAEGKIFRVRSIKPWLDFEDKEKVLGVVVEAVIVEDRTFYDCKPGEEVSNIYEPISFKVRKSSVTVSVGDLVVPVGVKATVYGEFRNKLSVKADDIMVYEP